MEQFTRIFFLLRFSQGQYYISAGNNPLSCSIYTDILKIRNDITLVPIITIPVIQTFIFSFIITTLMIITIRIGI